MDTAVEEIASAQGLAGAEPDVVDEQLGAALDAETESLLKDLQEQQLQVQAMLQQQREQSDELGGVKDRMAAELLELQDEAWRLQVYSELEMLKRQLAAINALDADLANMESQLDTLDEVAPPGEEAGAAGAGLAALLEGADINDADADVDLAGVDAMQQQLDDELVAMYKQLESVKAEAAAVSARKSALEAELLSLLAGQLDMEGGLEQAVSPEDQEEEETTDQGEATTAPVKIVASAVVGPVDLSPDTDQGEAATVNQ